MSKLQLDAFMMGYLNKEAFGEYKENARGGGTSKGTSASIGASTKAFNKALSGETSKSNPYKGTLTNPSNFKMTAGTKNPMAAFGGQQPIASSSSPAQYIQPTSIVQTAAMGGPAKETTEMKQQTPANPAATVATAGSTASGATANDRNDLRAGTQTAIANVQTNPARKPDGSQQSTGYTPTV